jgi:multidrug efflux pump
VEQTLVISVALVILVVLISVARPERRNRNTTRITSATEITSVCSTSSSEARMAQDRSPTIRASLEEVEQTLVISVALVILVVFLFLRSGRAAAPAGGRGCCPPSG